MTKKLTYFTPTYNRAHTLPFLYESLINQTNKNFVWLVIDDGSKDNTKELVDKWIKENKLEIKYVLKENGGKHTTIDLANQICETEYINCIDSDDRLSKDSTDILYKYFDEVSSDESLCGIVGCKSSYEGKSFNSSFPKSVEKIYFYELAKKYGYTQDTNLIFKTEIIKNFNFPKFENERFVTESVFYNKFLFDYKMLAIPEALYLAEYMSDGYTAQGINLFFKNPEGYLYALKQNTWCAIKNKESLKRRLANAHVFYAWKSALNLKEKYPNDYKISFFYRVLGKILSIRLIGTYKKQYKEFKEKNGKC